MLSIVSPDINDTSKRKGPQTEGKRKAQGKRTGVY